MTPIPTGRIVRTPDGFDLVLTRSIRGSVEDVWANITESDRTVRWFGRWEGPPAPGAMVRVQMGFEEGEPWCDVRIESCEPPRHLELTVVNGDGDWFLDLTLAPRGESTDLTFVQHRETTDGVSDIGAGWEYYLDNLLASREGTALPSFGDYYPSMKGYFIDQADAANRQT